MDKNSCPAGQMLEMLSRMLSLIEKGNQTYGLDGEWLTDEQARSFLKVSKRTMANYRAKNIVKAYKFERRVYYKKEEIEALLERGSFKNIGQS